MVRLTPAGALDSSFNGTGYDATFAPPASSSTSLTDFDTVAVEPSGVPKVAEDIVAGGYSIDTTGSQEATVAAFGNAGLDPNFGASGIDLPTAVNLVNGLTILPTGNVVAVGTDAPASTASFLLQYQATGSPAINFGGGNTNGVVTVASTPTTSYQLTSVAYDPFSGYLSVGGTATTGQPSTSAMMLAQYRSDTGAVNASFGPGGMVQGPSPQFAQAAFPVGVAIQPDGKVVAAGEAATVNGDEGLGLMRALGPTLSVSNAPTVAAGPLGPVTLQFGVSIDERLVNAACPILAAAGGALVPSGSCAPGVTITAGTTQPPALVSVTLNNIAAGGNQQATLQAGSGDGLFASTTNALGTGLVQHDFQQVPGAATDISIGANSTVWVIGSGAVPGGFGIYRWTGSGWAVAPGGATHIAVDPAGNPWVINSTHNIYHWNGRGWTAYPGLATAISVGADGVVWILGTNVVGGGFGVFRWNGVTWAALPGGGVSLAVDRGGNPWMLNSTHNIYHWSGTGWVLYPGAAVSIGVGADNILWVVGTNGLLYRWNGVGWVQALPGTAAKVAVAPNGVPWILLSTDQIFES